jgi:hypothetical protein
MNKYMKGKEDSSEEASYFQFNFKNTEPEIIEKIKIFFINKELKKYQGGVEEILKIKNEKKVGIAMVLDCEQEFHDKFYEKKPVPEKDSVVNLNEEIPIKGEGEPNPKWKELIEELNKSKLRTSDYIYVMYKSLSLDKHNKEFFERYIDAYCKKSAIKFKEAEPKKLEFYEANKEYITSWRDKQVYIFIDNLFQKNGYFKWNYEDFIVNLFTLMKFLTGLKLVLEIEVNKKVIINFFCTEKKLKGHAENFEYDLQVKNYALRYHKLGRQLEKQTSDLLQDDKNDSEKDTLIDSIKEDPLFYEMDQNVQFNFPPYENYEKEKDVKYMRYTSDDQYHVCSNDPELSRMELKPVLSTIPNLQKCCSNMRNIDRLRLIYRAFDEIIILTKLRNYKILDCIIYLRDYQSYKDTLHTE